LKYDVSGVDPEGVVFEAPTPGVYRARTEQLEIVPTRNGDDMLKVRFKLTKGNSDGKFKGAVVFENIVIGEASEWKLDQFLQAVGLTDGKRRKGVLDTDQPQKLPELLLRIKNETYEGERQAKVAAMLPFNRTDETDAIDASEEEDDETVDFSAMTLAELRKEAKAAGYETAGQSKADLISLLEDDQPDNDGSDEPDEEEDDEPDLATMPIGELRALAKEAGVYERGMTRAQLIEALADVDPGEEDEPDEDEEGYDSWELADLREEAKSRGLNPKLPKSKLVAALVANDEEDPFEQ
jgi:hypothetical protein